MAGNGEKQSFPIHSANDRNSAHRGSNELSMRGFGTDRELPFGIAVCGSPQPTKGPAIFGGPFRLGLGIYRKIRAVRLSFSLRRAVLDCAYCWPVLGRAVLQLAQAEELRSERVMGLLPRA